MTSTPATDLSTPVPSERLPPSARREGPRRDLSVMIGGQGGDGTLTVSDLLGRYFHEQHLYVYTARNVLSRIRGGHADASTRGSVEPVWAQKASQDVLVAFDDEAVRIGQSELDPEGFILGDQGSVSEGPERLYLLPLSLTAASKVGNGLYKNTVAYGALSHLLGFDEAKARGVIEGRFARRGGEALQRNLTAFDLGRTLAREQVGEKPFFLLEAGTNTRSILTTGNQATALGFVVGGGRFFAGYPITPATPIMDHLTRWLPTFGGVVRQAEDELSAINMTIGAAYAGARSMTATSGPGLSLMTEGMGHAGQAEVPVVIVDCQRVGPSTGEPTRHEQSDLLHVVFGSHGEFPRFVLAPGFPADAFELTVEALNLAEKWQLPVFLLLDENLSEYTQSSEPFDLTRVRIDRGKLLTPEALAALPVYKRYQFTDDGVSPRSIPGQRGGMGQTTGNEHDEWGHVSVNPENRRRMMAKRLGKMERARGDLPRARIYGEPRGRVGFIGYGSTYGPIREAQRLLAGQGVASRFFQARTLWPVPTTEVEEFLSTVERVFVVEHNYTGQLALLLRQALPRYAFPSLLKYDGNGFRAPELVRRVTEARP